MRLIGGAAAAVGLPVCVLLLASSMDVTYETTASLTAAPPAVLREITGTVFSTTAVRGSEGFQPTDLGDVSSVERQVIQSVAGGARTDADVSLSLNASTGDIAVRGSAGNPALSQRLANGFSDALLEYRSTAIRTQIRETEEELWLRRTLLGRRSASDPVYRSLLERSQKLNQISRSGAGGLALLQRAPLPTSRSPNVARDVAAAAVLGLMIALTLLARPLMGL